MTANVYLVIGRNGDGSAFLATRRIFLTRSEAERYLQGIASGYWPEIVESLPVVLKRPGERE
jgi:hypothetical protein